MNAKKLYIVIFAALFLLAGMFALSNARKARPQPKPAEPAPAAPAAAETDNAMDQKVLSFNLEGLNDRGEKQWEVNGESAQAVSENEVKLDNIVAKAYGEEAKATITADAGVYDKAKNNVRLEKNVKATIENKGGVNPSGGFFDISGQVAGAAGEKKPKKESTITITCDGEVQFDYVHNLAYFEKNVKVVSEDGVIYADKITVNLDAKSKKLNDILAEGNVRIVRGGNMTYSDKATYVEADKKVILTGKPKIVISQEGSGGLGNALMGK